MEVHSSILTQLELHLALKDAELNDVWIVGLEERGSRSHARKFKLFLRADHVKGRRRPNTGTHGAGDEWAPTYAEYGYWMAQLYRIDPDAKIAYYKNADDFHEQTKGAFA